MVRHIYEPKGRLRKMYHVDIGSVGWKILFSEFCSRSMAINRFCFFQVAFGSFGRDVRGQRLVIQELRSSTISTKSTWKENSQRRSLEWRGMRKYPLTLVKFRTCLKSPSSQFNSNWSMVIKSDSLSLLWHLYRLFMTIKLDSQVQKQKKSPRKRAISPSTLLLRTYSSVHWSGNKCPFLCHVHSQIDVPWVSSSANSEKGILQRSSKSHGIVSILPRLEPERSYKIRNLSSPFISSNMSHQFWPLGAAFEPVRCSQVGPLVGNHQYVPLKTEEPVLS